MANQDTKTRDRAVQFLERGIASPSEVALIAGVSRQLVNYWAAGIDWRKARETRLKRLWQQKTTR